MVFPKIRGSKSKFFKASLRSRRNEKSARRSFNARLALIDYRLISHASAVYFELRCARESENSRYNSGETLRESRTVCICVRVPLKFRNPCRCKRANFGRNVSSRAPTSARIRILEETLLVEAVSILGAIVVTIDAPNVD